MQKFIPQNVFSTVAFLATEQQIEYQNIVYPLGKLECYIFFSTYLSLQTSYLNIANSNNVDLYLMEGLESYVEYLEIDTEYETGQSASEFIKSRAKKLVGEIENLFKVGIHQEDVTILKFIRSFQSDDPINFNESNEKNIDELKVYHVILLDNLDAINSLYEKQKENLSKLKLDNWEKKCSDFLKNVSNLIKTLAVMPFEDARCNICGSHEERKNLEKTYISDSDMGRSLILPVCNICRKKHLAEDGWIHF